MFTFQEKEVMEVKFWIVINHGKGNEVLILKTYQVTASSGGSSVFSSRASPTSLCFSDSDSGILSLGLGCFVKQLPVWVEAVGDLSLAPAVMVSPATPLCSGTNGWDTCRRGASAVGGSQGSEFYGDW